ncbi:SCO family protein [Brackiella oedipodis]|uniref:SCO family protein n=1 Tax=Brackiella oedipodis TaxID=124225 RepID=UPI000685350C|nr:SCO family protein [Brackiella oedipodis]
MFAHFRLRHNIKSLLTIGAAALLCSLSTPTWAQTSETATSQVTTIYPIRGHLPDLRFALQGPDHQTITAQALRGKTVLVFFGYSHCPDICPTTLIELAGMKQELPDDVKSNVQILFISVDPTRDTPELLNRYVKAFDKDALGVTGSEDEIADIARRYRVSYQISKPQQEGEPYEVNHAQGIYIFDQKGRARYLASNSQDINKIAATLIDLVHHS